MATADCMITTIEEYNALRDSINEYVELLGSQLSEKDCAISDCHHYLELHKCSGPVLVKIASKLTLLLRERREIKDKLQEMSAIKSKICGGSVLKDNKLNRFYSVRTHVLDDVDTSRVWTTHGITKEAAPVAVVDNTLQIWLSKCTNSPLKKFIKDNDINLSTIFKNDHGFQGTYKEAKDWLAKDNGNVARLDYDWFFFKLVNCAQSGKAWFTYKWSICK